MFRLGRARTDADLTLDALDRSQAIVEFDLDGTVRHANANFLALMGYTLDEVRGQKHALFARPDEAQSPEYRQFWDQLRAGKSQAAKFNCLAKGGRDIWTESSYTPVLGRDGKPYKIIKFATDVTAEKLFLADMSGQVAAINRSQAVVEFDLDGTVQTANEGFLELMGYTLQEVKGRHHSLFVEPKYGASPEYRRFWDDLRAGKYQVAQFKRLGKGGRIVWIEASYTPILNQNGKPFKIVKYATDVTKQVALLSELKGIIDQNFTEIDDALGRSTNQADIAAGAVRSTSGNVQTMAASAEELAASVREIAQTMTESKKVASAAHTQLKDADQAIQKLSQMSKSMGGIVGLIRNIAGQINLLALNATIESARAGDAGKGFAVVAGEVKSLAQQASNATDQIAREIEGLQTVAGSVVDALDTIGGSINSVLEYATTTASAVEEQSAVTQEMSSAMQSTAYSVSAVNDNMTEISAAVAQVGQAVQSTRTAAQVLVR